MFNYSVALYDASRSFDSIKEDYFSHIYGADWQSFADYLEKINEILTYDKFSTNSIEGGLKKNLDVSADYAETLSKIEDILKDGETIVASHYNSDIRVQTVSVRLLEWHVKYLRGITAALKEKILGNDDEALKLFTGKLQEQ